MWGVLHKHAACQRDCHLDYMLSLDLGLPLHGMVSQASFVSHRQRWHNGAKARWSPSQCAPFPLLTHCCSEFLWGLLTWAAPGHVMASQACGRNARSLPSPHPVTLPPDTRLQVPWRPVIQDPGWSFHRGHRPEPRLEWAPGLESLPLTCPYHSLC